MRTSELLLFSLCALNAAFAGAANAETTGVFIDGTEVTSQTASGPGWTHDKGRIVLSGRDSAYGLTGRNVGGSVTIDVVHDATLRISNLNLLDVAHPSARGVISLATNVSAAVELTGSSTLSSSRDGIPGIACPPGSELTLKAAGAVSKGPSVFDYLPTNGFYRASVSIDPFPSSLPWLTVAGGKGAAAIGGSDKTAHGACGIINVHSNVCVYATGGEGAADIGVGSLGASPYGRGSGPILFAGIPRLYHGDASNPAIDIRVVPRPHNEYFRSLTSCDDCRYIRLWFPIGCTEIRTVGDHIDRFLKYVSVFPHGVCDQGLAYREPKYRSDYPWSGILMWNSLWCTAPTEVKSSDTVLGQEGVRRFYVASGKVDVNDAITCLGNVCLILRDGCRMAAKKGIIVSTNATLTIYCQDALGTGELVATGSGGAAGIGGGQNQANGSITINGGTVTATSGESGGAGIGGGSYGAGLDITINAGMVTAEGGLNGAGIGGGSYAGATNITINGGIVMANGGEGADGFGNGSGGSSKDIYVAPSTVLTAGNVWPPNAVIAHGSGQDLSENIKSNRYVMTAGKTSYAVCMDDWDPSVSHALAGGSVYTLTKDKVFNAPAGCSSLIVAASTTIIPAVLYIPTNVTLTVNGGNGGGATPGGAGINVVENQGLIICGGGTLFANGGNAGSGAAGSKGGDYEKTKEVWSSGAGGTGGAGGGGASAGIGGAGGAGGMGGKGGARINTTGTTSCANGNAGGQGVSGSSGATMGTVWVFGPLTVTATCGSKGSDGTGGSQGKDLNDEKWSTYKYGLGGGGGGGGGGAGSVASQGIGGGGAGGGGGGGGGSGSTDWTSSTHTVNGGTGGGGYGGASKSGTAGSQGSPTSPKHSGRDRRGGACGAAGEAGAVGGVGTFYVSSQTKSVTGRGSAETKASDSHSAITYMVLLEYHPEWGKAYDFFDAVLSMPFPDVRVPTRTGYTFCGYYTEPLGQGTKVFDENGKSMGASLWTVGDYVTVFYAAWRPN